MPKYFLSLATVVVLTSSQFAAADTLQDLVQLRKEVIEDQGKVAQLCGSLVGSPNIYTCLTLSFVYSDVSSRSDHLCDLLAIAARMKSSEDRAFVEKTIDFWTRFAPDFNKGASQHITAVLSESKSVSVTFYADKLSSYIERLQQLSKRISTRK